MRRLGRLVSVVALSAVASVTAGGATAAERIRSFDADLHLSADATFSVEERILYDFGGEQRRGIYRDIPVRYGRGAAADYRIELDVRKVTDPEGRERPVKLSNEGAYRRIRIGSPDSRITGVHEYRIQYAVRRGISWFDDHDELYWNVTGTEWSVPVDASSVMIHLPEGTPDEARFLCFTGRHGSVETACSMERADDSIRAVSRRGFGPQEGLTVVVSLPKGVIEEPTDLQKWLDRAGDYVSAASLLPFALFAGLYALWRKIGRDPTGPVAIPVRYEPPEGMTPAEMGTVLDEKVDMVDITATILDLAIRGHLQIEEIPTKKFFFLSESDYKLHRGSKDDSNLKPHEQKLLEGLFGGRREVELSDLRHKFYTKLPGIREALYEEVSKDGSWFPTRPDKVRTAYTGGAIALAVPCAVVAFATESPAWLVSIAACAAVGVFWSRHMPRKTRKGRRARQHILGLQEFVERVEKDRLDRLGLLDVDHFEKLLPFAFVLGAADAWAESFADLYTEPPQWYVGHAEGRFYPRHFVSQVGRSLDTAGNAMKSTPSRGSGGSGFGGGGSSGGGFGGGGGGSW